MNDGVKAIAQGLKDGGVEQIYNFPGFYSHDITAALDDPRMALSERVAFAEGFGSSLAGKRTVVAFKNVGLNVASDAFLHSVIAGVRAGLVLVLTDDIAVWGSQESQDSRHYFDFYGGLWLEPSSLQQAYDYAYEAFDLSEKMDMPVVLRLANSFFELKGSFKAEGKKAARSDLRPVRPESFVVHPYFYKKQEERLNERNKEIARWVEDSTIFPKFKFETGVIISGAMPYKDIDHEAVDILHVTTLPLPTDKINAFIESHENLIVQEDGDDYIAEKVRALANTKMIKAQIPKQRGTAVTFTKWKRHEKFFKALAEVKEDTIVSGEITQFTVETYNTVDVALSLGSAVSVAIGHAEASKKFTFCLSGDCSLLHEGVGIIDEAVQRNVKLGLVIFDNHASWCTGGQPPIGDVMRVVENPKVKRFYLDYDVATSEDITEILLAMKRFEGVSVLHLKVPLGGLSRDED